MPDHHRIEVPPDTAMALTALVAAASAAGTDAGREAADWWAQYAIGGRASGDVRATARSVLAGIADGDPAICDVLPVWDRSTAEVTITDLTSQLGATPVTAEQRETLLTAHADAYDNAVQDRVVLLCHRVASPSGTDLRHLHPSRAHVGDIGVFSGEWHLTDDDRYAVGYVGVLVRHWNGWAVFSCTRVVAEAIVAAHQQLRAARAEQLRLHVASADLDSHIDAEYPRLSFDGDVLVEDLRRYQNDATAVERVHPDTAGRYTVMGGIWCWEAVDPYRCDRLVGFDPVTTRARLL